MNAGNILRAIVYAGVAGPSNNFAAVIAAGAIPALVHLLGPGHQRYVQGVAAGTLYYISFANRYTPAELYCVYAQAVFDAGAIPPLVAILLSVPVGDVYGVLGSAALNLQSVSFCHAQDVFNAGAVPALMALLQPGFEINDQIFVAEAVGSLAANSAAARSAFIAAGAMPILETLGRLTLEGSYFRQALFVLTYGGYPLRR